MTNTTSKETLGQRIRQRREALGLTQHQLAQTLGVTPQHLSVVELDKRSVSVEMLAKLAQELGVSHWNLRDWKRRYGPPAPARSTAVLEAEVRALRRENEHLRAQRDILKKTLGILAEPGLNASPA